MADHSLRPGSPEWRMKQLEDRVTPDLPMWGYREAKEYFNDLGHMTYSAPRYAKNLKVFVWVDFEKCDDGRMRQVDKPVAFMKDKRTLKYLKRTVY